MHYGVVVPSAAWHVNLFIFYHTKFIFVHVDISMSHSNNLHQGLLYDWELKQKINVKYYIVT